LQYQEARPEIEWAVRGCAAFGATDFTMGLATGSDGCGRAGGSVGVAGSASGRRAGVRLGVGAGGATTTFSNADAGMGRTGLGSSPAAALAVMIRVPATTSGATAFRRD
jgi:hypothetical protein